MRRLCQQVQKSTADADLVKNKLLETVPIVVEKIISDKERCKDEIENLNTRRENILDQLIQEEQKGSYIMDYLQEWFRLEAENKAEKNKMQEAIDKQMEGLSKIFPYITKQQTETILSTIEQIVDKCCISSYQMGYNDALMAFAMGHVGIDGLTKPEA